MTISNSQIKTKARGILQGHWNEHIAFSIALLLLELLCGAISSIFPNNGTVVSALVTLLAYAILQSLMGLFFAGASLHFLKCLRGAASPLSDLLWPLKKQPDRYLIVELIEIGIGLLLYAPAMAVLLFLRLSVPMLVLLLLLIVAGSAVYLVVKAVFALSRFYLLESDAIGAIEAMKKSAEVMKGRKKQYVLLLLSFLGYLLLCLLTAGIGLIWVLPYILTSQAEFYESIPKD